MPGHRKRRQFKQTDAFTRGMVIGLKRAGCSIRQIAADTHLGASTVHRLWRRCLEQGNVAIYRNAGATRVTSARVDRRILRQAVAAPQATCTAILQHVQDTLDHSISTRTISRRLVANGLHSCRPLRRLPLTPPNRRQRLEWCRARSTDSRRVGVWRRRGERSNPAAIVERATVRQRGIMVWGAIAYDSRSSLLRIQGTMTAQRYVDDVLRPVTLPYLKGVPNALYPDLSPIEHVWDINGRRLHALPQPRSEDELWQMVEREWSAIPQDAICTLIDSLPRRVAACIAVRGKMIDQKLDKFIKEIPKSKPSYAQAVRQETELIDKKQQTIKDETTLIVALNNEERSQDSMKKTRSNTTMIEQTHNQVPQDPTTDSTVAASLRTLTLCLDQLLNLEPEEAITYDGDEPAAHFFSQLESQPNFHNLEPARQARKALSALRGEPRKIAQDLALLNKTYEEVKESLCAVYPRRPSFTLQEFYELKCTLMAEIETYYKNKVRIGLAINLPKSAIVQALSNGVPRNYGNLLKMAQPSGPEECTKAAQQRSPRQSRAPSTTVDKTHHILAVTVADNTGTHSVSSEGPTSGLFGPLHLRSTTSSNPKDRLGLQVSTRPQQRRAREKPSNANFGSRTPPKLNEPTCTLNQHTPVISLRPYQTPYAYQKEIQDQISQLLKHDIITPSSSPYSSPVTLVRKRDNTMRLCIDFRRVNEQVPSDLHPLPLIETVLDNLSKARVFSTVDMSNAYYQIPIAEESQPLLSFTIKDHTGRLFRWSLRHSAYNYEVKYLKGSRQYEADLLSRNPFCRFLSTGQIKDHQGVLRRDTRYILNDKDLMTITRRGVTKIIVPPSLRGTLLQRAHRDFNHPGISQMTRLIAAQYYWNGMTNDIRTHVRTCSVCQLVKPPKGPIYGELGQLPPAVLPYELVSLDTISGFAKYGNSQTFLHVVVDHATRFFRLITIPHNSVTGFPPSYLLLGSFPLQLSEHVQNYPKIDDARELAYQRTHERHLRDKARFDQTHRASDFEVGDFVLAKTYHHPDTGKLAPFFSGPYEILEIISPQIVRINRSNRPLSRETDTIHFSQAVVVEAEWKTWECPHRKRDKVILGKFREQIRTELAARWRELRIASLLVYMVDEMNLGDS
ncbi:hypothetical protein LAZ67_13001228 [Cordylochernes scorpioides]|uniref:RNA-directed DNA polymerase n=1 Tax=Cordylochernes scorpioides TaxID=51811 RepID=A0ABY6L7M5_9ARAC|nr:hypothetical protein LAZ67_13001228 [Cordylochernes scorpioides]